MLLLAGAGSVHDAAALNETRTLSFHHTHSNEDLTVTFKRDGRYDEAALKELNHYLRDWRTQDQTVMDPHLFDILWEVYRDVDGDKPIQIISSYRSPATNAMLHRRSSGVARFSQHMLGHAMDFFIPGVPLEQIRFAGLRLQRGGVGFYPTSGSPFVHLDTGSIRHWPGMTHDQLARVFPDGRTVHLPTDGKPLKGYELARADIEARDGNDNALKKSSPSLWAKLFKRKSSDDDDDEAVSTPVPTAQQVADAAAAVTAANKAADAKAAAKSSDTKSPTPRRAARANRAASAFQLASADAQIVPAGKPKPGAGRDGRGQTADPGRYHQCPRLLGRCRCGAERRRRPRRSQPSRRARRSLPADPQPTASVSAACRRWPTRRPPPRRSTAPTSSPPARRSRAAPRPAPRNAAALATEINTVAAKGAQGQGQAA